MLRYFLLCAALLAAACNSDKPGGIPGPSPEPSGKDIVDQVSQYDARPFDGEKRAGVFYEIYVRSFADSDGDGIGEPVLTHRKPASRVPSPVKTPADSDEFASRTLGLQWQWHANPERRWMFTNPSEGTIRLWCRAHDEAWRNLSDNGNLLLQKVNAPDYTATTKLRFCPSYEGDRAGLIVMGHDYATLGLRYADGKILVEQGVCPAAMRKGTAERAVATADYAADGKPVDVWLRVRIAQEWNDGEQPRMFCRFSYSTDGKRFKEFGEPFEAQAGHWIGAKIGYYTDASILKNDGGWADVDWFRVSKK